jgi:hypothetical protein
MIIIDLNRYKIDSIDENCWEKKHLNWKKIFFDIDIL